MEQFVEVLEFEVQGLRAQVVVLVELVELVEAELIL